MLPEHIDRVSSIARVALSLALPLALSAGACSDHSALAPDPPSTAAASSSGGSSSGSSGAGGSGQGGEGGGVVEPAGPTQLTIVNGVNDYDAIRLCFVPYPDGDGSSVSPWPSGGQGLAFAQGLAVKPITEAITPGTDVHAFVIGGDLAATSGKTCAQVFALASAPSPTVIVAPLAVLPASAFTSDRSLLLAATGCLGGPTHTAPSQEIACGVGYKPDAPTASLVALGMSRIKTPGKVSLQAVHASAALPPVDLRIKTGGQAPTEWLFAPDLTFGAVGPKLPFDSLSVSGFGVLATTQIITTSPGAVSPTSATLLSSIFAKSAIKEADFADGEGFVLVAVGGYPGAAAGPWWHTLTYALVRGDP